MGKGTPTDFTHDLSSTLKKRSAGFGIGDRFNRRSSNSPCPGAYELGTCFNEGNPVYKANPATMWAKRASRDAYQSTLSPGKMISLRGDNPGPGTYSYQNMSVGKDAKKFSFRRRTINHHEPEYHMIKQNLPGPGNYGPDHGLGINKVGKYYVSNMPNSRASVFSPSKRFRDNRSTFTMNPGPGTYQPDDISVAEDKVRTYVLSNFKTNGVSRMVMPYNTISGKRPDCTDRSIKSRLDTPGPG